MKISKKEARRWILQAGGLARYPSFGKGKNAVDRVINHLGYVQIDTISVVERAHHHVLATRVPEYRAIWLEQLQQEKKIIEYWAHAAAYLPIMDYRFTIPIQKYFRNQQDPWPKSDKKIMEYVLSRIQAEGPLMARDFESESPQQGKGWWDWKPAKLALERLFLQGSLVTIGRRGFQKIYDIPEKILTDNIVTTEPTAEEYASYLISRYLRSLGLASISEISYLRKNIKPEVKRVIMQKVQQDELMAIEVEGLENDSYFIEKSLMEETFRIQPRIYILSPFDHLTIQRNRLLNFFNYDYQIECYIPSSKRKFGYFCLPLIYGDQFIGRMDVKADRRQSLLVIKNIYFEGTIYQKVSAEHYLKAIEEYALFNECDRFTIEKSNDPEFLKSLINESRNRK